jgi:hypothetical protein
MDNTIADVGSFINEITTQGFTFRSYFTAIYAVMENIHIYETWWLTCFNQLCTFAKTLKCQIIL